jgi:ELWxxDGT repeat protein
MMSRSIANRLISEKTSGGRRQGRPKVGRSLAKFRPRLEALEDRVVPSLSPPLPLAPTGGTVYFSANDGVHGVELWKSNGTATGTKMVADINPGSAGSYPRYLTDGTGVMFSHAYAGPQAMDPWMVTPTLGNFNDPGLEPNPYFPVVLDAVFVRNALTQERGTSPESLLSLAPDSQKPVFTGTDRLMAAKPIPGWVVDPSSAPSFDPVLPGFSEVEAFFFALDSGTECCGITVL